ncbi:hypothetical protein, partial [Xanthomonas vasicola]|uniref:hypothetical protein n=1 Tax=Xanthomonas vasicola TaxID=56459 RepID=UPI0012FDAF24
MSTVVTSSSFDRLQALLQRPAVASIAPALREALARAWQELPPAQADNVPWALLGDTLDALEH